MKGKRKDKISPRTPISINSNSPPVAKFPQPSNETIKDLIINRNMDNVWNYSAQILSGGSIPKDNANMIDLMLKDLAGRKQIIDSQGLPIYSQKISDAIVRLEKAKIEINRQQKHNEINNEITKQALATENLSDALSQQIANDIASLQMTLNKQYKNMCDRQEHECQLLEEEWTSESRRRRYSHSSAHLRELLRQSELLFYEGRMSEYNKIKTQADELEAQEIDSAYRQWAADYNRARTLLNEKHKNENAAHEKLAAERIAALNAKGQRKAQVIENRKKAIETRRTTSQYIGSTKEPVRAPRTARAPRRGPPRLLSLPPLKC